MYVGILLHLACHKVASEQQAKITPYASLYGNAAAMFRFSKELDFAIKESSVQLWKMKYQMEIQREDP